MSQCDVCLGTRFEPYLQPSPCGRSLLRCRECGLVSALPSGHDAAASAAPPERFGRTDRRRAAAVMRLLPAGRILEIGCGAGHFLASLDPARYEVAGLEADPALAAEAARRIGEAGLRGGVARGSLRDAGLPSEMFDLVAIFGGIGSTASPRATCMEISRLLRQGGRAVIETPSLSSLTARLRGARWEPLRDPRADYFFTPASLERLAAQCGLAPGSSRLPMPAGWPSPGTLVYVVRKSAVSRRVPALADLTSKVGAMSPMGATH